MHYNDPKPWRDKENNKPPSTKRTRRNMSTGATNKKKAKKGAVNEDGYPIAHCRFEPAEDRLIYHPPGYAKEADPRLPYCTCCRLKPCIAEEFHKEGREFMFGKFFDKESTTIPAAEKMAVVFLHKKYCKVMKMRYLKKLLPPQCIIDHCEVYAADLEEVVVHSDSDESELSFDSEEEAEFTIQDLMSDTAAKRKKEKLRRKEQKEVVAVHQSGLTDSSDNEDDDEVMLSDLVKEKKLAKKQPPHPANKTIKEANKDKKEPPKRVSLEGSVEAFSESSDDDDDELFLSHPEKKPKLTKKLSRPATQRTQQEKKNEPSKHSSLTESLVDIDYLLYGEDDETNEDYYKRAAKECQQQQKSIAIDYNDLSFCGSSDEENELE